MKTTQSYRCWVKLGDLPDGKVDSVTYHSNDLLNFAKFLDEKYPQWRFFNVYKKSNNELLGMFTKKNRPQSKQG